MRRGAREDARPCCSSRSTIGEPYGRAVTGWPPRPLMLKGRMRMSERNRNNQSLFREGNERIAEIGRDFYSLDGEPREFVCVCGRPECVERFRISFAEYRAVRDDPNRFLVVPGHDDPAADKVVERQASWWLVELVAASARAERPR